MNEGGDESDGPELVHSSGCLATRSRAAADAARKPRLFLVTGDGQGSMSSRGCSTRGVSSLSNESLGLRGYPRAVGGVKGDAAADSDLLGVCKNRLNRK